MTYEKTTSASTAPTTTPPVDCRGNPCQIAEACHRFGGEEADRARSIAAGLLVHQIAYRLNKVNDRADHLHAALEVAFDSLTGSTDDDPVRGLLALAIDYSRQTCDECFELGSHVIAGLERGKLVEVPSHV